MGSRRSGIQHGGPIQAVTLYSSVQAPRTFWVEPHLHKNAILKCGCSLLFISFTFFYWGKLSIRKIKSDLHSILHSHSSEGKNPSETFWNLYIWTLLSVNLIVWLSFLKISIVFWKKIFLDLYKSPQYHSCWVWTSNFKDSHYVFHASKGNPLTFITHIKKEAGSFKQLFVQLASPRLWSSSVYIRSVETPRGRGVRIHTGIPDRLE